MSQSLRRLMCSYLLLSCPETPTKLDEPGIINVYIKSLRSLSNERFLVDRCTTRWATDVLEGGGNTLKKHFQSMSLHTFWVRRLSHRLKSATFTFFVPPTHTIVDTLPWVTEIQTRSGHINDLNLTKVINQIEYKSTNENQELFFNCGSTKQLLYFFFFFNLWRKKAWT